MDTPMSEDKQIDPQGMGSPMSDKPLHPQGMGSPMSDKPLHPQDKVSPMSDKPLYSQGMGSPMSDKPLHPQDKVSPMSDKPLYPQGMASPMSDKPLHPQVLAFPATTFAPFHPYGTASAMSDKPPRPQGTGIPMTPVDKLLQLHGLSFPMAHANKPLDPHAIGFPPTPTDTPHRLRNHGVSSPGGYFDDSDSFDLDDFLSSPESATDDIPLHQHGRGPRTPPGPSTPPTTSDRPVYQHGVGSPISDTPMDRDTSSLVSSDRQLNGGGALLSDTELRRGMDSPMSDTPLPLRGMGSRLSDRPFDDHDSASSMSDSSFHIQGLDSPPSPIAEKSHDLLDCPYCRSLCLKPTLMPCGHLTCDPCLRTLLQRKNRCPQCHHAINQDSNSTMSVRSQLFCPDLVLCDLIRERLREKAQSRLCQICEDRDAVMACRDCDEIYCEACSLAHARMKVSDYHEQCEVSDLDPSADSLMMQDSDPRVIVDNNNAGGVRGSKVDSRMNTNTNNTDSQNSSNTASLSSGNGEAANGNGEAACGKKREGLKSVSGNGEAAVINNLQRGCGIVEALTGRIQAIKGNIEALKGNSEAAINGNSSNNIDTNASGAGGRGSLSNHNGNPGTSDNSNNNSSTASSKDASRSKDISASHTRGCPDTAYAGTDREQPSRGNAEASPDLRGRLTGEEKNTNRGENLPRTARLLREDVTARLLREEDLTAKLLREEREKSSNEGSWLAKQSRLLTTTASHVQKVQAHARRLGNMAQKMSTQATEKERFLLTYAKKLLGPGVSQVRSTDDIDYVTGLSAGNPQLGMHKKALEGRIRDVRKACLTNWDLSTLREESADLVKAADNSCDPMTANAVRVFETTAVADKDVKAPFVTDLIISTDNRLVMADYNNRMIKVLEAVPGHAPPVSLQLLEAPRCLALLTSGLVAVTATSKVLYLVGMDDERLLAVWAQSQCRRNYYGVAEGPGPGETLLVACFRDRDGPSGVDLIDHDGAPLKSVIDSRNLAGLARALRLCVNPEAKGHVLIPDFNQQKVYEVEVSSGKLVNSTFHPQLKGAAQVLIDPRGNMLVLSESSRCVMVRSPAGEWRRLLHSAQHAATELSRPSCMCLSPTGFFLVWSLTPADKRMLENPDDAVVQYQYQ